MVAPPRASVRPHRLRALNLPQPAVVELNQRGEPKAVTTTDARRGPVAAICEAWRVDDEWWRRPISRQYFEVVLEGGAHVVVFEDLLTHQWFLQMP